MSKLGSQAHHMHADPSDRIARPLPPDPSFRPKRGWPIEIGTFVAYLAPPLGFALPLTADGRLLAVAAMSACSAIFALLILDWSNRHRIRLLIYGACVVAVFGYNVLKHWLGL